MDNNLKICSKCGANNANNSMFCISCGSKFEELINIDTESKTNNLLTNEDLQKKIDNQSVFEQVNPQDVGNENLLNNQIDEKNIAQTSVVSQTENSKTISNNSINYFKYLLNVVLKPCTEFKKQEVNFNNFKVSGLLALILVGFITIINLITVMYNSVRVSNFWTGEVEWVWENLKEINYIKVIGQQILAYSIALLVISSIYFLASLIIKKSIKFSKFLAIVSTSLIPIAIVCFVLFPFISIISIEIGSILNIISVIYGFIMLISLIDVTVGLENNDVKIYYHAACLSIIIIAIVVALYSVISMTFGSFGLLG